MSVTKQILKKIGLTLLSLVFLHNVYKLLVLFQKLNPEELSGVANFAAALAFNLVTTGMVAFLGFAYPTSKLLPSSYYKIKNTNRLNRVYDLLGVSFFRIFLLKTFYRGADNKKYFNGTKTGLKLFDYNTKQSEFGHLAAFVLLGLIAIFLWVKGHISLSLWTCAINLLFNFYPIVLQRKHRIIVQRLLK
ncbi:glycosyl-4,4'-diaponeurosporenoate acyltransferase CrtO family protein [Algoriphagus taiwanensis]|uniref:Glycosyl-4,4'-diaponeurosporenoate acyltransferase n=1 Tax=Algoriphagus taiwanensis TaxID=1445656 RepID=A0ABQ6PWX8_9BACT|nr:hypothetical protein Ataiwa_07300 [Algoriphagus taiwanensis]